EQLGEPERPVAADTRIGRLTAAERAHELGDHRSPELLAEVERHVWEAQCVARLSRRDHGLGRAAGALRVRTVRVEPQAKRHADRVRAGPEERDGAIDPAAPDVLAP